MGTRKEYIDKLAAQLREWDSAIQKLEAGAEKIKVEARGEFQRQIRELREKRNEAGEKLDNLKQSGEEAWQDLRSGADKLFADIKSTFERAASRFE